MFGISGEQLGGMVRQVIAAVGGGAVGTWVFASADELTAVAGAVAVLVSFVWSVIARYPKAPKA